MKNEDALNMTPAGAEILGALIEFRDALKDNLPIEKKFTVRTVRLDLRPRDFLPEEIKAIRKSFNLSQAVFGLVLGASVKTVRAWEQGLKKPSPIASRFLGEMAADPAYWRKRISELSVTKN